MAQGHGFGKVILFNEHFVVHGAPAIASAIGNKTVADVVPSEGGFEIIDNRPATPGYKEKKYEHYVDSVDRVLTAMKLDRDAPVKATLAGDLFAASGVGASAASCTALARALNDHFGLNLSIEQINDVAYEGEKGYHGTPSGLDNTVSTFGGIIWFKRGGPMDPMKLQKPVDIVMANTGMVADTKAAVASVTTMKEERPEEFGEIFQESLRMAEEAKEALLAHDLKRVGELMNFNHTLLQKIGVSTDRLNRLVDTAREAGAWGAKITGGGMGGYTVALTPDKELQAKVTAALEKVADEFRAEDQALIAEGKLEKAREYSILPTTIGE